MGVIAPGHSFERDARVQVSSTQTMLKRGKPDINPSVIVLDEFHHYAADEFGKLAEWWPDARIVGPTATPERGDGKPLSDIASRIVIAAQYSDLIRDGYLSDAVVYHPPESLDGAIADPLEKWRRHGRGESTFAFMPTIQVARQWCDTFNANGIPSATIDAKTSKGERASSLKSFADGAIKVIFNVDTMTEGVDIPRAKCALLARKFLSAGAYLQACGRVLRLWEDLCAVIIDLTGCSLVHGPPIIDREYSLDGGIKRKSESAANPVRVCSKCHLTFLQCEPVCPGCGSGPKPRLRRPPVIESVELQELWAGEYTRADVKLREYKRLRAKHAARGDLLYHVVKTYRELFGEPPKLFDATPAEKKREFYAMKKHHDRLGHKPAAAAKHFREMFGHWPAGF